MKIDFNNVRRQAISNFSKLVELLNSGLNSGNGNGMVVIAADEIQITIDDLRSDLVGIGATYQKDDPEFVCVLDDKQHIPEFNPSDEDKENDDE